MKGKREVINKLKSNKVIVIDGCPLKCSYNDVLEAVGKIDAQFLSTDVLKENRDLKPEERIYPLDENAKKLSHKLAEKIAQKVNELLEKRDGD